jgi:hypothetical protein
VLHKRYSKKTLFCVNMFLQRLRGGVLTLTGDNLKVVWAEFSTLSWAVFVLNEIAWPGQVRPHLELKTLPNFCPVSSSLFMD